MAALAERLEKNYGMPLHQYFGQKGTKSAIHCAYRDVEAWIKGGEAQLNNVGEKICLDIACMMMNAVPDILVVYQVGEKRYAKALECKYLSQEGRYEDAAGVKIQMQFFIQECIMGFLFGRNEYLDTNAAMVHYPKDPKESRIWYDGGSRQELWGQVKKTIYEGILGQELRQRDIINRGVEIIRFVRKKDEEKEKPFIVAISVTELLEHVYFGWEGSRR